MSSSKKRIAVAASVVGLGLTGLTIATILKLSAGQGGILTATYPIGKRFARIRIINENHWDSSTYYVEDIYNWVSDLQVQCLERFNSITMGTLDPNALLPSKSGSTVKLVDFFQGCIDRMPTKSNGSLYARLSADEYRSSPSSFQQTAQSVWDVQSILDPPQTLISVDLIDQTSPPSLTDNIVSILNGIGFKGYTLGACSANLEADAKETFAMVCETGSGTNWSIDKSVLSTLSGYPNVKMKMGHIDFPYAFTHFDTLTPDEQAQVLESLAKSQSSLGYIQSYNIYQGQWDSTQSIVSQDGDYWKAGDSIYTVCKNLMNTFNPL
jgi:hypothetical protein